MFQRIKESFNKYKHIPIIIIFVVFLIILANFFTLPSTNENQTLYLSSTLAQVSATLFGLTVAGYTFLEGKLEDDIKKDETLSDIVAELKQNYRQILLLSSTITGLALVFCTINIFIGDTGSADISIQTLCKKVINCSVLFSGMSILCTIFFIYKVTDPKRIKKISKKALRKNNMNSNNKTDNNNYLYDFLKVYNKMEQDLIALAKLTQIYVDPIEKQPTYKIITALEKAGLISSELRDEIQNCRKYRNYLVHGEELVVSKAAFDNLYVLSKKIHILLSNIASNK